MLKYLPLIWILISSPGFSQTPATTPFVDMHARNAQARTVLIRLIDSTQHPAKYARTLVELLQATFPANNATDGRWVYKSKYADLQKMDVPHLSSIVPGIEFYRVKMINYLGWHVTQGTCIIAFDSVHMTCQLAAPLWYHGPSPILVKMLIGHQFESKAMLVNAISDLHKLMQAGSGFAFHTTDVCDTMICYTLGFSTAQTQVTEGTATRSAVNYSANTVYRNIQVKINNLAMVRYTVINPQWKQDVDIIE